MITPYNCDEKIHAYLDDSFYARNADQVARDLLGYYLVFKTDVGILSGKIVETEAYCGKLDPACHAAVRQEKTVASMYLSAGHIYVYMIYGVYYCFNVVCAQASDPQAVLIRALEPIEGIEFMMRHRAKHLIKDLTNGPGKLCQAMGINKQHDGIKLSDSLGIFKGDQVNDSEVETCRRVGINSKNKGFASPLRFFIRDNPFVSKGKQKSLKL